MVLVIKVMSEKKTELPLSEAARLFIRPVAFRPCLSAGLALSYDSLNYFNLLQLL